MTFDEFLKMEGKKLDLNDLVIQRALRVYKSYAEWLSDIFNVSMGIPEVLPGPDGSIDSHWDYSQYEILINIPIDPVAKIGFYCDNRGDLQLKGYLGNV